MNASESNSLTFPVKLKRIVDAPETDHLIYWDEDGLSFHIVDENQLARDVIPNYFKHNNISSFIRQLNMYGFHKINRIENGLAVIGNGKDDSQWNHPLFLRDQPDLLQSITRKVTNTPFSNSIISKRIISNNDTDIMACESIKNDIAYLAKAVQHLKQRDEETSDKLKTLQEENHQFYSELMYLREEHDKQSKLIDILIKFFSLYANNPSESRLKSKRVFAIEMPNSKSPVSGMCEPPKKYFVTSPISTSPQPLLSNDSNNSFKGKKVIKISPQPIVNSNNNNRICTISHNNNQRPPKILSFTSLTPKNKTSITIPTRAITGVNTSSNNNSSNHSNTKPTFVIPNIQYNQSNNIKPSNVYLKKPIAKTVTVSYIDSKSDNVYNAQYFNYSTTARSSPPLKRAANDSNHITNSKYNENVKENNNDKNSYNFKTQFSHNEGYLPDDVCFDSIVDQDEYPSDIFSQLSANVTSVDQGLKNITKCLTTDSAYPSNTSTYTNISDMNCELDNEDNSYMLQDSNEMPYEDLQLLWDNIRNSNLDEDGKSSDPSKIQGNELIPFNHRNEWQEPIYNYHENFSIDDLLQTPEIHPEESSISLNNLKDSLFPNDFFNDISSK